MNWNCIPIQLLSYLIITLVVAMAHGICELLWLKVLLKELEYDYKEFMRLYCNRKAMINIAHNPV